VGDDGTAAGEGLESLYARSYGRLVATVAAICGSVPEAEESVQDAFVRLIGCWATVGEYDDPEAWLRKVALGFASNRRRKSRNGFVALRRHGPAGVQLPADGDAVDVGRALAQLSRDQREVIVLQHYVGLDVEWIARELAVPVGTVKSRLARARARLQPLLEEVTEGA
jgi:RNA polymerase sigma factor (sigma-70 family)